MIAVGANALLYAYDSNSGHHVRCRTDAALAAISIEPSATLGTADRDFRRFDGLMLLDPRQ
jgi:predicted nucleic acid-binding protein